MLNHVSLIEALKRDLLNRGVLADRVITGLVRYFDPNHADYVKRVSAWQAFVCQDYSNDPTLCWPLLVQAKAAQSWGDHYILGDCHAVRDVHQIALFFWKELVSVSPDWSAFKARVSQSGCPDRSHPFLWKLREYLKSVLPNAPKWSDLEGTLSSGVTADRRTPAERWHFDTIPFDVPRWFYQYNEHDDTHMRVIMPYARAAAVPKNRKSPRFVASELSSSMYAQLAIKRYLDGVIRQLYGNRAPIWDADRHRTFLRSRHSSVVTIDLSDASDYISLDLISYILPPNWVDVLNSCRSQFVLTPDGDITPLMVQAPMGNGYCFRLLTLVCCAIMHVACRLPWSDFGDDMICHQSDWPAVCMGLEACGLVINKTKTCFGRYKETCGLELLDGVNVTPFKFKRALTLHGVGADLAGALRAAELGLPQTGRVLYSWSCKTRFNRRYQRLEALIPCWVARKDDGCIDGWAAMQRWYSLRPELTAEEDVYEHLQVVPGLRWAALESGPLDDNLRSLVLHGTFQPEY
jgi:hypothetical protein